MKATSPHVGAVHAKDAERLKSEFQACTLCSSVRQQRLLHEFVAEKPAERPYSLLTRPMKTMSLGKAKYFLTLLDEHTKFSTVRL